MGVLGRLFGSKPPPLPEDRTVDILKRHVDPDFTVFPLAETAVTLRQIQEIGARFGVRYPPEFCAHVLGAFPGMFLEVKENVWPRPKPLDVGRFWTFLYAIHTYTSAPASVDWMRLDHAAEQFQQMSGLTAAPILQIVGDRDVYCVDAAGSIMRYEHDRNRLSPVQMDFWGVLDHEVAELRARKLRKVAGES